MVGYTSEATHADYKYNEITITVLRIPESADARPPFA